MKKTGWLFAGLFLILTSCNNSFQKVVKSNDLSLKYEKAKEYYADKQYLKAEQLFEELMSAYKGTQDVQEILYYYSYCFYYEEEYLTASYNFKNYYSTYGNGPHAEECLFQNAMCYYKLSPYKELDQDYTNKAIDAFQIFVNSYPTSSKVATANDYIDGLRRKLEQKDYMSADLYFRMSDYKAASIQFADVLRTYPETKDVELISFRILRSDYLYAINSIEIKKADRYADALKSYNNFVYQYPKSTYRAQADDMGNAIKDFLDNHKTEVSQAN